MKLKLYSFEPTYLHLVGKLTDGSFWSEKELPLIWKHSCQELTHLRTKKLVVPIAYVLMANHYHLLLQQASCIQFSLLNQFPLEVKSRSIDHIQEYREVYRYIYRNPVQADLVTSAEDYKYSSLQYVLGWSQSIHPFRDNMNLLTNPDQVLKWLNNNYSSSVGGSSPG